jgi:hypothetical protein
MNPFWIQDLSFENLVKQLWSDPKYLGEIGKQHRLIWKLKDLKLQTKIWLKERKLRTKAHIKNLEEEITECIHNNSIGNNWMAKESLVKELEAVRNKILMEKEEYWRQRSRAIWLQSGDNNTNFFHNFANYRRKSKHLWDILDESGDVVLGQENIKKEAVKYFKEMYKEQAPPTSNEQVRVAALFKKMMTEDEAHSLNEPIKLEEIEHILKKFKSDKSLGPDGWSVEFFNHFFETVGGDLL